MFVCFICMNSLRPNVYNPSFKAHYYKIDVVVNEGLFNGIITDNKPYMGKEPVLVINDINKEDEEIPMTKTPKGFIANTFDRYFSDYKIFFKDTKKYDDNNGENYTIAPLSSKAKALRDKAIILDKINHNQPLNKTIVAGEASGEIVFNDNFEDPSLTKDNPIILVSNYNEKMIWKRLPENVVGLVLLNSDLNQLEHLSNILRDRGHKTVANVQDEKSLEQLKNLEGKYAQIKSKSNNISIKETQLSEISNAKIKKANQIKIPKMKYCDEILDSKDYELNTVGAKAYNLKLMQEMVDNGELNDVIIPPSIAVTHGYIEKFGLEEFENTVTLRKTKELPKLLEKIKEAGIGEVKDWVMIRSSFNGEDIDGYSAAGLYGSYLDDINKSIFGGINRVVRSKDTPLAKQSRLEHNIPDEIIKPTVIIQKYIDSDYKFTIYTKDVTGSDKNLIIEMNSKDRRYRGTKDPYLIEYNKDSKELNIKSYERNDASYIFDENGEVVDYEISQDPLTKDWKTMKPILDKVVENALVLEDKFGKPQDIEGGIKDGKIYFWQTRAIVE
ncbi:MAG: PEP/pyruvate-binding domain-containing protein [Candidatus Gastranaerophilales bacterium]